MSRESRVESRELKSAFFTTHESRLSTLLLSAVCVLCFFWRLGAVGLFDFNEGFYTQVAREMYLRGDYITPRVNGILFFDKPPLALWLSALSFHLFGVNEFAARFPVAVASTLIVFLTYGFGTRFFGRRAGLLAGAMVALNPLFYGTARQMTMDIHQTLWFAAAMVCFFRSRESRVESRESISPSRLWPYAFWFACGMGVMAKSIPGLFPILVALIYLVVESGFRGAGFWTGFWKGVREMRPVSGSLLLLLVVAPWFALAYRANGRVFYEEFWILHHVKLASGADFNHSQPFWYYLPALLGGFFPYSLFLLPAVLAAWRERMVRDEVGRARIFVLVWGAVVFLLFTAMKSKLVSYLLPMYPAAALLVGDWLARALEQKASRSIAWVTRAMAALAVVLCSCGIVLVRYLLTSPNAARQRQDVPPAIMEFGVHALILAAVGLSVAAVLVALRRQKAGIAAMLATSGLFVALSNWEGMNAMEARMNAPLQSLAREAGEKMGQGMPLAIHIAGPRRPSVFFYLPDAAFLAKQLPKPGEEGIILERGEEPPIDAFLAQNHTALVLTDRKRADALLVDTPGLKVMVERDRWVLLRKDTLSSMVGQ